MQIVILGQNPKISLAELESVYSGQQLEMLNHQAAIIDAQIDISRLGGAIKVADSLVDRPNIDEALSFISAYYQKNLPQSKLNLGVSYYGANTPSDYYKKLISLKKSLSSNNISVRIVNQANDKVLNAAQIKHNKLTAGKGAEWLLVKKHGFIVVAKTEDVQDIDDYAARDQVRPSRDAKIGMLPPKLAKILVNLAAGGQSKLKILDPFCGSGVVLQEACLLGHSVFGSDVNPAMVRAALHNLDWLASERKINVNSTIEIGNAENYTWPQIDAVASETYLGPPLSKPADHNFFSRNLNDINSLHEKFLTNIHQQLKPGTRLALALPAWWQAGSRFQRLPLVDRLNNLGYNRLDFESVKLPMIYHREGQYVGRDIIVMERI